MNNIPNLNDMLKLYTKKDLWERIQHHIKRIDNLQSQLDQQKAMWKMLKYFIINRPYCAGYVILESGMRVITDILATMRKLEKGEDDE